MFFFVGNIGFDGTPWSTIEANKTPPVIQAVESAQQCSQLLIDYKLYHIMIYHIIIIYYMGLYQLVSNVGVDHNPVWKKGAEFSVDILICSARRG